MVAGVRMLIAECCVRIAFGLVVVLISFTAHDGSSVQLDQRQDFSASDGDTQMSRASEMLERTLPDLSARYQRVPQQSFSSLRSAMVAQLHANEYDDEYGVATKATVVLVVHNHSNGGVQLANVFADVHQSWSEDVCNNKAATLAYADVVGGSVTDAKIQRQMVKDHAFRHLADNPTGAYTYVSESIVSKVPGVLSLFHKCWDHNGRLNAASNRQSMSCQRSTFHVSVAIPIAMANALEATWNACVRQQKVTEDTAPELQTSCYNTLVTSTKNWLSQEVLAQDLPTHELEGEALLRRVDQFIILFG
eukprot:m.677850 g.677850  ORF g.677850 m.677850 type:complete len:306 (+) comp22802_c0_seq2:163-1080(+)